MPFLDYLFVELTKKMAGSIPDDEGAGMEVTTRGDYYRKVTGIADSSPDSAVVARAVIDTVCSITDQHVVSWHEQSNSTAGLSPEWALDFPF